mmetsp:Transcript_10931/g.20421  ORF Transcript_10931/g.20421 Transcript_10931/m.20421 type:complete len:310 (-) Transcript_10931:2375-3304(-)
MSHNPLLGSRISLISKKNIRYEGTLYLINEADATVALQNVRSYGTEGRESETETFVPPQDQVYPHLLFRGCDIKDLHVHENTVNEVPPNDPAIISAGQPPEISKDNESAATAGKQAESKSESHDNQTNDSEPKDVASKEETVPAHKNKAKSKKSSNPNRAKKMIGTGASLLNRKARGGVDGVEGPDKDLEKDFDFQSNLAEFIKDDDASDDSPEDEPIVAYKKDNFFDSLSNDVLDRQSGVDNRLRGAQERSLNTETFGATSLDNDRRFRRGGRGRGRGRGGRGRGRGGGRRQYGDGGLSNNKAISSSN